MKISLWLTIGEKINMEHAVLINIYINKQLLIPTKYSILRVIGSESR